MSEDFTQLQKVQRFVLDLIKVQRNHLIPGDERRENVVEHSFSTAMICWRLFEMTNPPLSIEKIMKYAIVHDSLERGQRFDVNTYAGESERNIKKEYEKKELIKLNKEFEDFTDFVNMLNIYEKLPDDEAIFVWSADKIQHIILGSIDNWRPYASYGVSYDQFCEKGEDIFNKCSPYLKKVLSGILKESKKKYYDRPKL